MSVPDHMVRCRLRRFEDEKPETNVVFGLVAGSAEAIEKFLREYYYFWMPDDLFGDDLDFGQTIHIPRFGAGQKIFHRYTLTKILGRGGMGIVWLAEDEELEGKVALKVLPETLCHDRESLKALKQETKLGLHLAHPNIVRIYDFQRDDNAAAISMEYVDGATFSEMRSAQPTHVFDPADLHLYIEALCDALHYAHNRERIVHRDLKPRNLMLNSHGDLKIADFGISRTISDSMIVLTGMRGSTGSPPYISPQQWDGDPPTPLDDIYSLGATLYELLSSKPPFSGVVDWQQVHYKIPPAISKRRAELGITGAAPIPAEWEETIAACLAKNAQDRPQTVRELQARLTINGEMPVRTAETKAAAPAVSSGPEGAKPVDFSEEDLFDEPTLRDLPEDTLDTATVRAEPSLDAPTAPVERSSAPASEPMLKKLDDVVKDEVTPQHVSTARAEPKLDTPTAPIEVSGTPASEPILGERGGAVQEQLTPPLVSTARAELKLDAPTAPVEVFSPPPSKPIPSELSGAIQEQLTPPQVSTARAEPKLDAPTTPVEVFSAPPSKPALDKLGGPVQEQLTPPQVSTPRAEPKLDAPTAPVEVFSAPPSKPALDKLGGPVQDHLPAEHVSEAITKIPEPTADAEVPATEVIAEPALAFEPPVRPADAVDVLPPETATPTNGDVAFPSVEIEKPDRPDVIRPRRAKVPGSIWVAAATAISILGIYFIWRTIVPPQSPPSTFADLLIESEPSGAKLTLDGSPPIKTPHTFKHLKFGTHRLTMTLDGYSPIEHDIEFSGASLPKVVLEPRPKLVEEIAKLSVRSDPPGATIRLDGTLPQEPNTFRNVKFGQHHVTAAMDGFEPQEQFLVVSKDTSSEIVLKFPRIRDPLQPLLDELKKAEAAHDWVNYHMVSLQLLGRLTSLGEPASNAHRDILTTVIEGFRKKETPLTSEDFHAYEKNLNDAARLDIVPAILVVADKLKATNCQEAFNWYYYAAEKKNNAYAMTRIAWVYSRGECGQQVDKARSFEWFQRGRQLGDTEAARMAGVCYLYGIGTPKNEDEGIRILEDLAKLGEPMAITVIGQCYYYGFGHFKEKSEEERYRMAKSFFEQAIKADEWDACGYLGFMYEWGQGVKQDWKTATRIYFQGVEHESPICMYYYAQALENHGPEIRKMLDHPQDDAKTYYVKAAKGGVTEARAWCVKHNVSWKD
jgi:serine/threonine protein kinase/TPR repeat protein